MSMSVTNSHVCIITKPTVTNSYNTGGGIEFRIDGAAKLNAFWLIAVNALMNYLFFLNSK